MSKGVIEQLLSDLRKYNETREAIALGIRLDFGSIIARRLRELGWSDATFSRKTGLSMRQFDRLVQGCNKRSIEDYARLLYVLKVGVKVVEDKREDQA